MVLEGGKLEGWKVGRLGGWKVEFRERIWYFIFQAQAILPL